MVSGYLLRPLRTLEQAQADEILMRFYVHGYEGCDWESAPVLAPSASAALAIAAERYRGTKFHPQEVDPRPDAMRIHGETVAMDRRSASLVALAQS